ncbi:MAG: M20 family metallo-hydrolase [Kofleriaceae bacterium]|nr:M20 family metallo-hydrolase [Kofleriaceae bacterium]MCB9571860.1 M20 family metallo-hydrolase [Kofleriaceae bacterium]
MSDAGLRIDGDRLLRRLAALAEVGAIDGGGVCRLALTDADRAGRDLVTGWMRELGLTVTVDRIGNVVGTRAGAAALPPVMMGSHIDTVRTGGRYDGNLGVLAGLEVIERLIEAGVTTRHPVAVGFFTNEEGARFAPDMMGSAVHQGALPLDVALATVGIDGATVGDELARIGYAGDTPCGEVRAAAYLELHVEQGPVLEREGVAIGAVTGVQGISWTELTLRGVSNHAGTTPMSMRTDAGYVAAEIACFVRRLARDYGGAQVATVGHVTVAPNLVNVIPNRVVMTVDLRNTDDAILQRAERDTAAFVDEIAAAEGVAVERRTLARFAPVDFAPAMVDRVEAVARAQGHTVRRMPSGAGHDAQMFAPHCPTGMIFVPSAGGISHNVREFTEPAQLIAGADVLLQVVLEQAG